MTLRRAFLLTMVVAVLCGCGSPPSFPSQPPSQVAPYSVGGAGEKPEPPPPPPKGVSRVEMDAGTRSRVMTIVICTAVVFLVALILCFAMRAGGAIVVAGISAAFFGLMISFAISARRFAHLLGGLTGPPFDFAQLSLSMWNENQPVLAGLYSGTAALIILLAVVAVMRRPDADSQGVGAVLTIMLFLAMAGAMASFVSFLSMNRLIMAAVDPVASDPLARSIRSMSIAGVSQGIASRLMVTLAASVGTAVVLLLTIAVSFTRRQSRKRVAVVVIALALMLFAALVERSWSDVLATTARTGRVPDTLLTR